MSFSSYGAFLILFTYILPIQCFPVTLTGATKPILLAPRELPVCNLLGNSDLYGLGIRLGIYMQWTSSLLANNLLEGEILSLLDTNTTFLLAVFSAIAKLTVQKGLQLAEILILLRICFGFLFGVVTVNAGNVPTPRQEDESDGGSPPTQDDESNRLGSYTGMWFRRLLKMAVIS